MGWRNRGPQWKTLGMSYESALQVTARKSAWMVHYLRARRTGDILLPWFRSNYLRKRRASLLIGDTP